ncbi:MAG: ABC transporter ATP-binding protein [Candidatus Omnitrophica bacterium]|nr:ABC transporter ATP-binding protein [Candidatus Omnitrophota bacterium]
MSSVGLIARDIYKIYKNGSKEVRAVNGVNLEIKKGESLAIVGPSGAGKSTLLHILGGLDNPTRGNIFLDGVDIYRLADKERARIRNRRIGFVFQFYHLLPEFSALENVMMPGLIRGTGYGVRGTEIKDRAREVLKLVGLKDRASHKPSELSGGESQRVAIARALINEPEILLCDEPTGNLDSKTSESVLELILNLKSKNDLALLIVTHDEKITLKIEKTLHIRDGKLISPS